MKPTHSLHTTIDKLSRHAYTLPCLMGDGSYDAQCHTHAHTSIWGAGVNTNSLHQENLKQVPCTCHARWPVVSRVGWAQAYLSTSAQKPPVASLRYPLWLALQLEIEDSKEQHFLGSSGSALPLGPRFCVLPTNTTVHSDGRWICF